MPERARGAPAEREALTSHGEHARVLRATTDHQGLAALARQLDPTRQRVVARGVAFVACVARTQLPVLRVAAPEQPRCRRVERLEDPMHSSHLGPRPKHEGRVQMAARHLFHTAHVPERIHAPWLALVHLAPVPELPKGPEAPAPRRAALVEDDSVLLSTGHPDESSLAQRRHARRHVARHPIHQAKLETVVGAKRHRAAAAQGDDSEAKARGDIGGPFARREWDALREWPELAASAQRLGCCFVRLAALIIPCFVRLAALIIPWLLVAIAATQKVAHAPAEHEARRFAHRIDRSAVAREVSMRKRSGWHVHSSPLVERATGRQGEASIGTASNSNDQLVQQFGHQSWLLHGRDRELAALTLARAAPAVRSAKLVAREAVCVPGRNLHDCSLQRIRLNSDRRVLAPPTLRRCACWRPHAQRAGFALSPGPQHRRLDAENAPRSRKCS